MAVLIDPSHDEELGVVCVDGVGLLFRVGNRHFTVSQTRLQQHLETGKNKAVVHDQLEEVARDLLAK